MLLVALFVPAASTLAQTGASSPSPTLPSDTLEANYAPRSAAGPMPELAPSLPSDTLDATQPVDSFPTDPFVDEHLVPQDGDSTDGTPDESAPQARGDSAALQDLRSWIKRHPNLISPPPVRAVLVRA